nr:nitrilase-related carbon-nitrogen hydrolase [Haliscomenobacter sp.]
MQNLKIASVQFEHRSGDKAYNLAVIEKMAAKAAREGAKVIAFHECSITGYTFARNLSKTQMLELAEYIPSRSKHPRTDTHRPTIRHRHLGRAF